MLKKILSILACLICSYNIVIAAPINHKVLPFEATRSDVTDLQKIDLDEFMRQKKRASEGDAQSQFVLGGVYLYGLYGVKENESKALYYLTNAAFQGHVEALKNLSLIYYLGVAGNKKHERAVYYMEQAAIAGDLKAQDYVLALLTNAEDHVEIDLEKTAYWLKVSGDKGNKEAKDIAGQLCLSYKICPKSSYLAETIALQPHINAQVIKGLAKLNDLEHSSEGLPYFHHLDQSESLTVDVNKDGIKDKVVVLDFCEATNCHLTTRSTIIAVFLGDQSGGYKYAASKDFSIYASAKLDNKGNVKIIQMDFKDKDPHCCPSNETHFNLLFEHNKVSFKKVS